MEEEKMTLKDFLKKFEISTKEFAKRTDISVSGLDHYMRGDRHPTPRMMKIIEKETAGRVTAKSLWRKDNAPRK
jgi:transcriptional regulator with XRE-family HTH domain